MRITVALSIIAASASVALAATLDIPREIVIGLSPFQPAPDRTNQQYVLQRFLLGQCPTSTRVVVWDAWQIQVIADVQPYSLSYDSPAARAPRLAQALAGLGRWSASSSAGRTADTLKDSDAIKVPEWLDAVAATPPTGRRTVVILASPFCLVPDEPSFSMVQTRFPSDGHLNRTTADSVYGTADKRGHLAQTVVLWAYSSEDLFASQYHRRSISRWWSLYIASQGPNATLAGFSSDPAQTLLQSLRTDHQSIGEFTIDPADSALVMHVATGREIPIQIPQAKPAPLPAPAPQPAVVPPSPPAPQLIEATRQASPPPPRLTKVEQTPTVPAAPPVLVTLDVGVTDSTQTPIPGLSRSDFTVLEDNVKQDIASFSTDRLPISLVLLLDTSGSIAPKLDNIRAAASSIIHQCSDHDEFCVIEFKANTTVVQDFTADVASADRALATLKADGQTALLDAARFSLDYAARKGKHPRKGIVLITDGGEADSQSTRADVLALLQRGNVQFYAVGFPEGLDRVQAPDSRFHGPAKPQPSEALARNLLDTLAKASSGGLLFFPRQASELGRIAESIVSDLHAPRYTVGYYPIRPQTDSGWRAIQVTVRPSQEHGQLTARTRAGYYPKPTQSGNAPGVGTASTSQPTP